MNDEYDISERFKRQIRLKIDSFPKISFVIFLILAITNILVIIYLISQNDSNSNEFFDFAKIWALFICYLVVFIFIVILSLVPKFRFRKIITYVLLTILPLISITFVSIALFEQRITFQTASGFIFIFFAIYNIFGSIAGFIALYLQ